MKNTDIFPSKIRWKNKTQTLFNQEMRGITNILSKYILLKKYFNKNGDLLQTIESCEEVLKNRDRLSFKRLIFYCNKNPELIDFCYNRLIDLGKTELINNIIWCWSRTINIRLRRTLVRILGNKINLSPEQVSKINLMEQLALFFSNNKQ